MRSVGVISKIAIVGVLVATTAFIGVSAVMGSVAPARTGARRSGRRHAAARPLKPAPQPGSGA